MEVKLIPDTIFTDEEIDWLLDYLDPVLDDEEEGKIAFSVMRKIYNMRKTKDEYGI